MNQKREMKSFRISLRNVAIVACLAVMTACNSGGSKQNAAQSGDSEKTAVTTVKSGCPRPQQIAGTADKRHYEAD
jgi:hypothetical protein